MERQVPDLFPKIKWDARFQDLSEQVYHFLGYRVHVRTNDEEALRRIGERYCAFRETPPDSRKGVKLYFYILKIEEEGLPYYYLIDPGSPSMVVSAKRNVAPFLNAFVMVNHVFRERKDLLVLHGAAASFRGAGFIFLGESGVGKTTLSLALMRSGFTFFSDEFAPLRVDLGRVLPYPRSLEARLETLKVMESLGWEKPRAVSAEMMSGRGRKEELRWIIPPEFYPALVEEGVPISFIILLQQGKSAPAGLGRISKAEALGALFTHALNADFLGGARAARLVRQCSRIVRQARCCRLGRGKLPAAVEALKSLSRERVISSTSELKALKEVTAAILSKLALAGE